jgi:hypothetical protein
VQHSEICTLRGDPVYEAYHAYFASPNPNTTAWALEQVTLLSRLTILEGIHSMPLHNTRDWWKTALQTALASE